MEKIKKLRQIIKKNQIDGYIISKNDEFFEEYTPDDKDRLKFISNFSGSYGFALVLKNMNYLFVDGRYTLQANNQSGKYFKVVTIPAKMPKDILKNKKFIIGFDPKLFTKKTLDIFFKNNSCKFKPFRSNFIDEIWNRKIKKNKNNFYCLSAKSASNHFKFKINKVISYIKKRNVDYHFISASENSAWLLNIRGSDTNYTPLPYCKILISKNKNIKLFCNLEKITPSFRRNFKNIQFLDISSTSKILSQINDKRFIIDKSTCSFLYENIIFKNNIILDISDPIYEFKSIKNIKEIKNIEKAHIYDGVALTKYLFWIKNNFEKKKITEISASQKLYSFRKLNKKFKFSSFPTISGTGPNGAIIHYKATNETNRVLKKGDIYLVDSGGQYEFGTTDVTRTISLKNSNKRVKNIFTRVLKGHIAVSTSKLNMNSCGALIDKKARKYLNQVGLDYSHGTGHGVGYFLNVHEGPHAISKNNKIKFKEGMIVSNEPGYYEKNKFGIRIENLIYVKKKKKKTYFKNLTMAPIEKELINIKMLNSNEKKWLNDYHREVYGNLKNSMSKKEVKELKLACSAI